MKILVKVGTLMIILGTIIQLYDMMKLKIIDKMKEQYCYNLPLNTFYQDQGCSIERGDIM